MMIETMLKQNDDTKLTREYPKGLTISNVTVYPNGKKSNETKVKNLATIGLKLKGEQMIHFVKALLDMYTDGHREVNITGWRKQKTVTFAGKHIVVEKSK